MIPPASLKYTARKFRETPLNLTRGRTKDNGIDTSQTTFVILLCTTKVIWQLLVDDHIECSAPFSQPLQLAPRYNYS